jgi:hypothetical protein
LKREAVHFFETLVSTHDTAWSHNPEHHSMCTKFINSWWNLTPEILLKKKAQTYTFRHQ